MAFNKRYENISIQQSSYRRSAEKKLQLEKLSEHDLVAKSTVHRKKKRVARLAKFPLPVVDKPIPPVPKESMKKKKKHRKEYVVEMNPNDPLKIIIKRIRKSKRANYDSAYNDSGSSKIAENPNQ